MLDSLLCDGDWFDEEPHVREVVRNRHQILLLAGEILSHEPVGTSDTAFDDGVHWGHIQLVEMLWGCAAVGVWPADRRDDDGALLEVGIVGVGDDADSFVAQHEMVLAGRKPTVLAREHLDIGSVDTNTERPDQRLSRLGGRLGRLDADGGVLPTAERDGVHTPALGPGDKRFIVNRVNAFYVIEPAMDRHTQLYRLYEEFDTGTIRARRDFVDLFPPVDSRVALAYWRDASDRLERDRAEVRQTFPETGEAFATIATLATRDQAFTALDLLGKHGRALNVLVLDVDETLRSAGKTDNEIPRQTLHLLTEFYEAGVPIVVCTGQTLENVKGFLNQGLGNELVHSGELSVVYEAGNGVFTPGHGADTKQLLYERLDEDVRNVFDYVRSHVLADAPERIRHGCHLQGNEFNVTLKPNFETGSDRAGKIIDEALRYQVDLLGEAVAAERDLDGPATEWARKHYAAADPEIQLVLDRLDSLPAGNVDIPDTAQSLFDVIDVAYYEADAAEIGSLELNKVAGVEAALDVLGVTDPFGLVMGDSKSDLRVMRWVHDHDSGIAAAPNHASTDVLAHVQETDDLVFDRGAADDTLRMAYALNELAALNP